MTDIVERLRRFKSREVCVEAADEIERLRAYVEEWKRRYETARSAHEEGRVENERLVAELNKYELAALQSRTAQVTRGRDD